MIFKGSLLDAYSQTLAGLSSIHAALAVYTLTFFVGSKKPDDYMDYFEGVSLDRIFWLAMVAHILPCINDALIIFSSKSCLKEAMCIEYAYEWREFTRTVYMVLNLWLVLEVTYLFAWLNKEEPLISDSSDPFILDKVEFEEMDMLSWLKLLNAWAMIEVALFYQNIFTAGLFLLTYQLSPFKHYIQKFNRWDSSK